MSQFSFHLFLIVLPLIPVFTVFCFYLIVLFLYFLLLLSVLSVLTPILIFFLLTQNTIAFELNYDLIHEKICDYTTLQLDKMLSILFQSSYSLSCAGNFFHFVMSCKYEVHLCVNMLFFFKV